ncbi:MAG: energy transducer TonB [Pseudomonadota bacterium]
MGWRFIIGLPLAAIIAFALFVAMSHLIDPGEIEFVEPKPRPDIELGPEREDSDDDIVERPDPSEIEPPEPPDTDPEINIDPPDAGGDDPVFPDGAVDPVGPPVLTREVQPLVRVPPQNWERCLTGREGEEHYVTLVLDVSPTGETANVEAVDSSLECLERSAVRAAEGWRYAPKLEEGEAVWRYGAQTTIRYRVEG